ncbi:hypothetical protein O181_109990 [Austropuccinia psidii MF-1]|uniref:Uncharacterized protein n=1 Tax=Austropuccinia psidii MF-1 TaxID=1389203 RepID=A0A9Q3PR28_9BASI|nr:hypothetical protein [Austropuccinia psidii MF-1]
MANWIPFTGHILQPFSLLANSPPHQPPGQYLCFGPEGSLAPLAITRAFGPTPLIMGSMAPFGLHPMRSRGHSTIPQVQVGLKPQVDPHEPNFDPKISTIQNGQKRTPGPKLATSNPWPLATTKGHQLRSSKAFP